MSSFVGRFSLLSLSQQPTAKIHASGGRYARGGLGFSRVKSLRSASGGRINSPTNNNKPLTKH